MAADKPEHTTTSTSTPVKKSSLYDKSLAATANLAKLLPTGTTLAFQTLVPSFTNHGNCYHVNRVFSWGLVGFLSWLCAVLSFTDSITHSDGNTCYGLALLTSRGFYAFNYDYKGRRKDDKNKRNGGPNTQGKDDNNKKNGGQQTEGKDDKAAFDSACKNRRVRARDFLHAFFRSLVFLSLAFDDAELQTCLLGRRMTVQWKEFIVNMPLAMGFLASFVFMIFPSYRKGIGYDADAADSSPNSNSAESKDDGSKQPGKSKDDGSKQQIASPSPSDQQSEGGGNKLIQITDVTRVVPSTIYELDPIV